MATPKTAHVPHHNLKTIHQQDYVKHGSDAFATIQPRRDDSDLLAAG